MALKTLRARCFSQHVNLDTSLIDKMKVVDLVQGIEFSVTNSSRFTYVKLELPIFAFKRTEIKHATYYGIHYIH